MAIAGSVAPVFRDGGYDATATYDFYHALIHNNRLCFCRQDGTIGHEPQEESDEYWFLSLDGNFADAVTLNGKSESELSVANSEKLGGKSASEFASSRDFFSTLDYTYMENRNVNAWYRLQLQNGMLDLWETTDQGVAWTKRGTFSTTADLANYQNKDDSRRLLQPSEYPTVETDIRSIMWTIPSGHYIWDKNWTDKLVVPIMNAFIQVDWERIVLPDNGMAYGILTLRSMIDNSEWATCSVYNNAQYTEWEYPTTTADLANYLPLDGSVPMTGNRFSISNGHGQVYSAEDLTAISSYSNPSDASTERGLRMWSKTGRDSVTNAFVYVDGHAEYIAHHDGNSAKVVQATSAPSDTTAVWVDTANKVIKIYKDGAWTALA